eukprot:6897671-Alexandrium_andersonii.AAC.1
MLPILLPASLSSVFSLSSSPSFAKVQLARVDGCSVSKSHMHAQRWAYRGPRDTSDAGACSCVEPGLATR